MQNLTPFAPPYLGAAYYPEDWDESEQEYDIAMMKKAGLNSVRIAEFAWHKMEPEEGKYDFTWLHRVVNRLGENGIAVILGTPSATPPHWLIRKYPDIAREDNNGNRASHGGRRHCCSNNPHYRAYSAKIAEEMAKEFADDPYVIGWQIDNEIYDGGTGCMCPECRAKFTDFLRHRYGTVEELNRRWNLNLFSQAYDRLEDVVQPRNAWHNPHLQADYVTFQNESHIDFVAMQAEILHRYVKVPVGTDTMPFHAMDYRHMFKALDIVQFNHYNEPSNLWQVCLWFDHLRTLKEHPFWNTETATCWNGSVAIGQSIKPEGYCRANSMLPLALGGEANMYWLWRTHWAGHELTHGSVLDSSGRPMHIFGEVQDTAEIFAKSGDFLNGTKVATEIGFHFSSRNHNLLTAEPIVGGTNPDMVNRFYRPLLTLGLRPDVIDETEPLDKYKLIFSPLMLTLEEDNLAARMSDWVRAGGTWVVGPLTDNRNADGAHYQHRPFGILEELTGKTWCYGIPDRVGNVKTADKEGKPFRGGIFYDLFRADSDALVTVTEGHSAINGLAAVMDVTVGKGHVVVLGTFPEEEELTALYRRACTDAGIPCGAVDGDVLVCPRKGEAGEGVVLVEIGNRNGFYRPDGKVRDLLTEEVFEETVPVAPYGIRVLVKQD